MMKRLFHRFQKSLRYKLMLLMVTIAIMPLILVTLFAANTTKQSLSLEVIRSNESRMDWAAKYLDEKFDQLQAVSYSLLLDHNLFPNGSGGLDNGANSADAADSYIQEKLRSLYIANNKNIVRISLYLKSKHRLFVVDKDAVSSTGQLQAPFGSWGDLDQSFESVNRVMDAAHNNFTLVRTMNRFENREVLGGISLDVRWNMMNSVLDMIHSEPNSQVMILDNQGNVMYNPYANSQQEALPGEVLKEAAANSDGPGHMELKQGLIFYQPAVSGQLRIVKFIPMNYLTKGASSTLSFSFFTAVIFIVLAIMAAILTAYYTTKPIIRLTKSMKAVEFQNFDVSVSDIRSDEIGTLERRFNSMLQRIKELIQIEYKSKIEKRTAQLKAMQAQINPHFLQNALQAIGGIAISRNVPEIYEHVRAISDLFRYTIRMKSDLVTVADELEHVSNYLQIQKLRFQDMIRIHLNVDDECRSCQIPKFSLQPIVENCFVHGLEGKMAEWSITITAQKVLDEIEISIEDNGVGMEETRLEELRSRLNDESEERELGESLGLGNVHSRIKLIFGEEYGLFIDSRAGAGTTVKVVIPAVPQHGEEEAV
ncbi:sensor histidine kinase [Paenibacillus sp. MZ04-78.2]|uniref:sensor histidine kinase n=1 Tax=Paenibacillus sp. MZ04-78.2 TaxID=2962034 RepID=UPI0020B6657C|nr:histidine kinase [Paenibacillus sp. MZ04-78.2]MCP3772738.1 sensor histidine kinase [Paenibacillus sp. MZ04-78.2]